jgi:hypothetical protein
MSQGQNYDIPDEHLSYSELKDRIAEECARNLPKKERILLMAKKLEKDLTLKETICDQICNDLGHVTSERHIRRCLPDEYKMHKRKKETKVTTLNDGHMSVNEDKNIPEQKAMIVDTQGYEESFEDIDRKNVEPASEIVQALQKKIADITTERDDLSTEVKTLKEKTQPQLLQEIQDKFYDEPGLIDAKRMQKISIESGKNLQILLERYNSIIQDAIDSGQPVPVGTYIITKPDMKLVPIRITVDFERRKIRMSLWEKKLQDLNI